MCTTGQDGRGTAKDKGKATHLHPTTFHIIIFLVVRQKNINQYIFLSFLKLSLFSCILNGIQSYIVSPKIGKRVQKW